jgi:hypothetical protein
MRNIGGINVTGGSFPARIWKQFMERALEGQPVIPFGELPELPERRPARLYLPYVECGYDPPSEVGFDPFATTSTSSTTTSTTSTSSTTTTVPLSTTTTLVRNRPVPSVPTDYIVVDCGRFTLTRPRGSAPTTAPSDPAAAAAETPGGAVGDDPSVTVPSVFSPQGGAPSPTLAP